MAKKKNYIKGAKKRKLTPKFKYVQGGEAYALPTSMNATTSNMMGLGDPNMLNAALARSTEALQAQREQAELEEKQNLEMRAQQSQQQFQNAVQQSQQQASSGLMNGLQAGMQANRLANIAQGTANTGQVVRASADTGQLLTNLGNYGTQAQSAGRLANAGQAIGQGVKAMGPAAGSAGLSLVGSFIEHKSDDLDPTTMNFGETTGKMMKGAGMGLGLASLAPLAAIPGIGWIGAGVGALGYGIHGLVQRNKARKEQEQIDQDNEIARINMSRGQASAFNNAFTKTGADMGFNVGNSMTNSYTPSQQIMYRGGGEMIKRADGSYSPRGLWDNIRANEGSGKKPTKEMLEQEKKIKAQEKKEGGIKVPGGKVQSLGGDAVKFVGRTHAQGGIMIDPQTEVENNETMDKVQMKQGEMSEYIFSDHLKLGGVSFAKRHERLLKNGANQKDIQQLAKLQEAIAAKEGKDENGPRGPERIMKNGGSTKYQLGDFLSNLSNSPAYTDIGLSPENIYYPQLGYAWKQQGNAPNIDFTSIEVGQPGSAAAMQGSPFQTGYDLPANMTDEELEDFYVNTHIPRITRSFNENREQVIQNAKDAAEFADVNKQNFDLKIRNADGSFISDDEIFNQALALTTDRKIGSWHVPAWRNVKTIARQKFENPGEDISEEETAGKKTTEKETTGKERIPNRAWMAALPGLVGLGIDGNYPGARTMSPQMQRGVNLPRINMNAERAANSAMNVGMRRQLSNQLSGPAGVAASLAANQQARQQNLAIGNEEARGNKELMAQEAGLNANIAGRNQTAANQAGMFNANKLQERDVNQFEQKLLLKKYKTDVIQQAAKDAMQYQFDERLARATDDTGSYIRFLQENPQFMQTMISQMNNTANAKNGETTTAKRGGYIKRGNKLKRKKK